MVRLTTTSQNQLHALPVISYPRPGLLLPMQSWSIHCLEQGISILSCKITAVADIRPIHVWNRPRTAVNIICFENPLQHDFLLLLIFFSYTLQRSFFLS
jgi:hypothetical protein